MRTVGAIVLMAGLAAPVSAQYVLDRNLQQGSGGVNPRGSNLAEELRFRNAIVTGNAPGGLSFRGNVGYRAPGEFAGAVGSDDTFSFRRDSVYSGMGGMGLRGTDALQYQFAMTTGMRPPAGFGNTSAVISRTGAASTAGTIQTGIQGTGLNEEFGDSRPRWSAGDAASDVRGLSLSAMRTPSAFVTSRTFQPTILGTMQGVDGQPIEVTASVLRGVSYGPSAIGRRRSGEEVVPTPADLAGLRPPTTEDLQGQRLDLSIDRSPRSPYQELLERLRGEETSEIDREDPAGVTRLPGDLRDRGDRDGSWRNRLTDLRVQLQDPTGADRGRIDPRYDPAAEAELAGEARAARPGEINPQTIEMLRRAGQMDALAPRGFDAYAVHMESAQQHLSGGRFFDAEERFTAALSAKPGDPMAAIGRIHAELGAGMFLSASINLRDLLLANPEVAGVRYAPALLPSRERMGTVKERLVELIGSRPAQARENGMLLAYLGHQSQDPAAMERGLAAMEAAPPEGAAPTASDEQMIRLATLLRGVWTSIEAGERGPAQPAK